MFFGLFIERKWRISQNIIFDQFNFLLAEVLFQKKISSIQNERKSERKTMKIKINKFLIDKMFGNEGESRQF